MANAWEEYKKKRGISVQQNTVKQEAEEAEGNAWERYKKARGISMENEDWRYRSAEETKRKQEQRQDRSALNKQKQYLDDFVGPYTIGGEDAAKANYYGNLLQYGNKYNDVLAQDNGFRGYKQAISNADKAFSAETEKNRKRDEAEDKVREMLNVLPGRSELTKAERALSAQDRRYARDTALYNQMAQAANQAGSKELRYKASAGYDQANADYALSLTNYAEADAQDTERLRAEDPTAFYAKTMSASEISSALEESRTKRAALQTEYEKAYEAAQYDKRATWKMAQLQKQMDQTEKDIAMYQSALSTRRAQETRQNFVTAAQADRQFSSVANIGRSEYESYLAKERNRDERRASEGFGDKLLRYFTEGGGVTDTTLSTGTMQASINAMRNGEGMSDHEAINSRLNELDNDMKELFYYWWNKDKEKALSFLEYGAEISRERQLNKIREWANDKPVLGTLAAAGVNLFSGADYLSALAEATATGSVGAHQPNVYLSDIRDTMHEGVTDNFNTAFGKFVYQVGTSMLDSAIGMSTGNTVPTFFLSAASSEYLEAKRRGASDEQALLSGTLSGLAECVFEEVSVEKLLSQDFDRGILRAVLQQSFTEASEEVTTSLANTISDIVLSNAYNFETKTAARRRELMASGMSYGEANSEAKKEWLQDVLMDGLAGAASGGAMTGFHYVGAKIGEGVFKAADKVDTRNRNEKRGATIGAEEAQALRSFAEANGIKVSERVAQSTEENETENAPTTEQETKLSRREIRQERKANRDTGALESKIVDKLAETVHERGLNSAQEIYTEQTGQHGNGITRAVQAAVTREAQVAFAQAQNQNELNDLYQKAVENVTAQPVKQAIQKAYTNATTLRAYQGDNQALRDALTGPGNGGALKLNAELTAKDGSTQQVRIASLDAERGKVKLDNGETVALNELQGLDADTKDVIEKLDRFDMGDTRALAFHSYLLAAKKGEATDGVRFVMEYALAYDQGRNGVISLEEATKRSSLPADIVKEAYDHGALQTETWRKDQERQNAENRAKAKDGATGRKGILDKSRVSQEKLDALSADKKDALRTLELIAEATGVDIRLIEQKADKKGNVRGYQGKYSKDGNYIEIDVNAGLNNIFKDMHTGMTAVLGHELTHWMQENAPTEYLAYKKAVLQAIMSTKNGELTLERMIEAQINQNKREGKEITRSQAEDEVVADASMKRLGDSEFWDAVADNLGEKKADVFAKIKEYISQFFNRVREIIGKASHTSEAAKLIDRVEADVQANLRRLYAEGIGAAMRSSAQTGTETKNAATEGGDEHLSTRDYNSTVILEESTIDKYLRDYASKSSPNYAQAYIVRMSPNDFLNLTTSKTGRDTIWKQTGELDVDKLKKATIDQPFQLNIDTKSGQVEGHEGRHRAMALYNNGVNSIPVLLFDSSNKYDKTALASLELKGQDFGKSRSDATVTVQDVQPLSYANRDNVVQKYTTQPTTERMGEKYGGKETIRYSTRSDTDYLDAVERGDMETAQQMVDEAAVQWGAATDERGKPIPLYHGTPRFGFTVFKDPAHEVPFIYTSTNPTVSAHYAGDKNYAGRRPIGRKYRTGTKTEDIIENAKWVYESNYHVMSTEEKLKAYKEIEKQAIEIAEKLDEVHIGAWNAESESFKNMPDEVANAISWVEDMFWTIRDSDYKFNFDGKEDYPGERAEFFKVLDSDIENAKTQRAIVQEFYDENRKNLSKQEKAFLSYLLSYEVGDAAIDIEYKLRRVATENDVIMNEAGNINNPLDLKESMDMYHETGAYTLYGNLGDNPFIFDANGAQFWGVKVPEMGDGYYSTDSISKWAYENGYTGVVMKNIYDYGDKADNYVFFNSSQLKSADPVTYDDSDKVIPLSERFNPENEDIRYSTRDYSDVSDLDLLLNAADEISEGGGEDYWASLLSEEPGLANETEEIKRLGKQLKKTEGELAEARRNLTLTDRKLKTRGIASLAATIMQDQKAGDINKKDVHKRITAVLTEAYQKALDQLDAGTDIGTAWETVYSEGVVKAADILLSDATYAEKHGYGWVKTSLGQYLGEGAREYVEADIAARVAQDFETNRYRPGQKATTADRLVAQAENRLNKKLDAAKTENAALKAENTKLSEDKAFFEAQAKSAKETAGDLYQQLLDKREELKNNKQLSAQERKATLKKLDNMTRQMQAKRKEAQAWKEKAKGETKKLNQAIREKEAAVSKLEKQLQRERDILEGKLKPPAIQKMLAAAREREAEKTAQHKDEVFARYKERKNETALRGRIKNLHDEMNRDLLKPREGHFVPQGLIRPVVDLLDMVNTQTKRAKSESAQAKIDAINAAYDRIKNDERYSQYYDETVKEMLTELSATLEGRSIYELSYSELEDVYTVMKAMRTTIRNSIKADAIEKGKEVLEVGNALRQELRAGKGANPLLLEKYHMAMLSAERAFHRFGGYMPDSMWDKTYRMLDNAQLKALMLEMQATRLFDSVLLEKADFAKAEALTSYDKKDLVDVGLKDANGNAVPITRGMMLSLYMHLQNEENMRHLMYGGLTLSDFRRYYKGQENAWGKGSVSIPALGARVANLNELLDTAGEAGVAAQYEAEQQAMREMWESVRGAIEDQLSEYDRKWIAASKDFFDNFSRRELNRVTNEMYGFSKAKVDNYFPIVTDKNFLKTDFDSISRDISLENAGFMKERVKAGNPILLEDITKAVNRQISNVARYAGLTQALKTFNNVYNVQTKGYTDSVKKAMSETFEDTGKKYIENLITDMVGGRTQPGTIFDRIKGNYAQAVLSANLSVTIKQAASFWTAAATVGWKPLMKALAKGGQKGRVISRADKSLIGIYTPLLWKRSQGAIDTEIGDMAHAQDWTKKAKWLMGWIEKTDIATVGRLWYAAEYYVKENFDLAKGTEAQIKNGESPFYQKVAEVFNQIVEDTQPNYTILQRPDILRNPNKLVRAMTMFSTQRFQNANILIDAAGEYNAMRRYNKQSNTAESKAALKSAKQKLTRAISSQVVSAAVLNVMTLVAAALMHRMNPWRDDDDEITAESIREELMNGFLSTMAGSFLAGSELYEAVSSMLTGSKYYGNDVGGISTINEFATAVVQFGQQAVKLIGDENSKPSDWTKLAEKQLAKVGQYLAQMTGIPAANINKIIAGGKNHIIDAVNGEFFSFEAGVERSNVTNARRFIKALEAGDEAKAEAVMEEMRQNILKGKPNLKADKVNAKIQSAVQSYVKQQYLDDEMSEEKAIHYMVEYGSADDENDAFWKIREWEAREAWDGEADDFTFSKYTKLREIIDNVGDISEEMQYLQDHGVKFEDANKEIKSYIGKQLKAGEYDEDEAMETLQAYHKVKDEKTKQYRPDTEDEAWFSVQEWMAQAEHADEDDYSWNRYEDMFAAMDTGGDIEPHADELESHGVKSDTIKNAVVAHVKERYEAGEVNASEAMRLLQKYRGMDANEAYWKVDEWDAQEAAYNAGEEFSSTNYRDLYAAMDANKDAATAIKELTDHGYKNSQITEATKTYLKTQLEEGKITETQFRNKIAHYLGITKTEDADVLVKEVSNAKRYKEMQKQYPNLDFTSDDATRYYDGTSHTKNANARTAEKAGLSLEAYLKARTMLKEVNGYDNNGDGKADNYSREKMIIQALNGMNLTAAQKWALYYEEYEGKNWRYVSRPNW